MFFKKRKQSADPKGETRMEPAELLKEVGTLAKQGLTQKQIAEELGFKTTLTLNSHLLKASQATGKPVPSFGRSRADKAAKRVEVVEVKQRGKGEAFGVNIPQEPLVRAGIGVASRLSVKASKGRIVLTVQ